MTQTFEISPLGPFDLRESVLFGFGHRHETHYDGVMRLALCVDGFGSQAGVELRQEGDTVRGRVTGEADVDLVRAQVARVLSLDHDARPFAQVGRRDPVIGALQRAAPGLRPPLFGSPYEAAVWSIISTRRAARQAAILREELGRAHGRTFTLAGRELAALPTPKQLLDVAQVPGLAPQRVEWLHGVARAALDGALEPAELAAADPETAMAGLRRLGGIGPFYAALIVIRSTGVTDVLPVGEPRALALAGRLYGAGRPLTPAEFAERARAWQGWRTWATVLIRAVSGRLPA